MGQLRALPIFLCSIFATLAFSYGAMAREAAIGTAAKKPASVGEGSNENILAQGMTEELSVAVGVDPNLEGSPAESSSSEFDGLSLEGLVKMSQSVQGILNQSADRPRYPSSK